MADIRYKWNDGLNSVQVSGDVSLPQFKVLGHRQKTIEASLSTGREQGQGGSGPSGSLLFAAVNNSRYVDLESAAPAHELRRAW